MAPKFWSCYHELGPNVPQGKVFLSIILIVVYFVNSRFKDKERPQGYVASMAGHLHDYDLEVKSFLDILY